MRPPALVPQHVPLADAARIARQHGFVLRAVEHEGQVRIAMVRPDAKPGADTALPDPAAAGSASTTGAPAANVTTPERRR